MLNQMVLVGRLVANPEVKELETGKKVCSVTLAVPRPYKNSQGEYDTDFISCKLWDDIAQNTSEFCKKGDIVGVKGRLQSDTYEKDGEKKYSLNVIAEKVTFLSSTKSKDQKDYDRE